MDVTGACSRPCLKLRCHLLPGRDYVEDVLVRLHWILYEFEPGTIPALLMTRPGAGEISELDQHWTTLLTEVAAQHDVPLEPIFRVNDESLVQVEAAA